MNSAPSQAGSSRLRVITAVALAAYLLGLAAILLWPNGADIRRINLDLYLFGLYHLGLPPQVTPESWALVFNVALPAPVAAGLTILDPRRRWWLAALIVGGLCGFAEIAQGALLPSRFASWSDVAQNSTGALMGALLAAWALRKISRTSPVGR